MHDVIIRPFRAEDSAAVCRIWSDGLPQSALAAPWFARRMLLKTLEEMRETAVSDTGDVGPNGRNLIHTYGNRPDITMFVACLRGAETVVGCCAVKRGMDERKTEPDSQIASIWRMSVHAAYQGSGIATQLMTACENWAGARACTKMGLMTINPIAANFYTHRVGYRRVGNFHAIKNPLAKLLIKPVGIFEKPIGENAHR